MIKAEYTYEEMMSDLKNKIFHPIYFLTGPEPYFIDKITNYISENVLQEEEKSFNQTILYGKETSPETVINSAKRFPMMANHQVIIVKEAQEMDHFEKMIHYFEQPLGSTLLVINYKYKNIDKRTKLFKSIREKAVVFESKKLYDNKIPDFISKLLKPKGYQIEPKAAVLLTEFLGNDLSKIENELQKLILNIPEGTKIINSDQIERNIGISKEYNNFELQKALVDRDPLKANRIIRYFANNQKNNPIILTITSLYSFYSKILTYHVLKDKSRQNVAASLKVNPYFVQEYEKAARVYNARKVVNIISILREYDVKSKGFGRVSTNEGDLLKELIFKILH